MKYEIMMEGHEGVVSCNEERLTIVDPGAGKNEHEVLIEYCKSNPQVQYSEDWQCFVVNGVRKVFARPWISPEELAECRNWSPKLTAEDLAELFKDLPRELQNPQTEHPGDHCHPINNNYRF
jgi:hypothetical protein